MERSFCRHSCLFAFILEKPCCTEGFVDSDFAMGFQKLAMIVLQNFPISV